MSFTAVLFILLNPYRGESSPVLRVSTTTCVVVVNFIFLWSAGQITDLSSANDFDSFDSSQFKGIDQAKM